uniref:nucleolar protein dao-5 n=1 Tax=Semicossyphus pulcher TaxID=241346 RepID=UPI0037E78691
METKYPTLKRPKRKLCYLTNPKSPAKKWAGPLTLEDIDKMFDDFDPSSNEDVDIVPPSPLQTSDNEANQSEKGVSPLSQEGHVTQKLPGRLMGPKGDTLHPNTGSPSPKLDIDLDIPFKAHRPVKTSSPIERVVEHVAELDTGKDRVVSPILFACEDEGVEEEAKTDPPPTQKPQCNGHITEENADFDLESPPIRVTLSKPKMSCQKNEVEGSCKESQPVKENASKKPQTAVLNGKGKIRSQETTGPPVSAVRQEPEVAAPKKKSESVQKQPSAFQQKLREAGQSRLACSRKSLLPVKVPTPPPPEPEEDFQILEDDTTIWISIPTKTATSKKQRQSRTSSTDKDSSSDKGAEESPLETAPKQQESQQADSKAGKRKTKVKEKKNEVNKPENDIPQLSSPEDVPAVDFTEQEKPNKKKRLKKVPSKESDKAEEQPEEKAGVETDDPSPKVGKKAQALKSGKDGKENAKTGRAKSLKGARKVTQGADAGKEMVNAEEPSQELAVDEDLGLLSDKETLNYEAPPAKDSVDGKDEQSEHSLVSERSSAEGDQILGKRKRKQTGEWWLPATTVTYNQPTVKKSKQIKEPIAATPSPVKAKKDKVVKKKHQTERAPSYSQDANKEKKTKQRKNRNKRGDTPDRMKATEEVCEQTEEQEQQDEVQQDLDLAVQSSPLDLAHRDHSLSLGDQVFQRVYHYSSNEKVSITPAPVSPRGPREQLTAAEPEKRRRKPPGNWWTIDGTPEGPQPQQHEPKARKERTKKTKPSRSPKLGTPKNGNVAVSLKPQGGDSVPPMKVKPLSAPKTVKRSLATYKDLFETPTVVSSREADQRNRRNVAAADRTTLGKTVTDILSMDTGESNSPANHDAPQDGKCQSENTLEAHRSGPSSMIELQEYVENEDNLTLPSSTVQTALSASDLFAPPLKPLILQQKDKDNLKEWFRSLWSAPANNGPEISPDQFNWFFHQGRAIGFLVDLNCGTICNGKILLGSYMKKPLWVDHSATSVFNILTSSVRVTINGNKSLFNPGQSFMVPCGHAYSIQNVSAQPAVLYFTRILAESSD